MIKKVFLALVILGVSLILNAQKLQSPDGNFELTFSVENGKPYYSLVYKNKPVINKSGMGFELKSSFQPYYSITKTAVPKDPDPSLKDGFELTKTEYAEKDDRWTPVWGEVKEIRDHYKEMVVTLDQNKRNRYIQIRFRLFNDGLGFRYEFPRQKGLKFFIITDELTEFRLADNHKAFWQPGDYNTDEFNYTTSKISEIADIIRTTKFHNGEMYSIYENFGMISVQTPLMLKGDNGLYISIHEAALLNYPAMNLNLDENKYILSTHLVPDALGNKAYMQTDCKTPWRTVIVSDDARDILASKTILNLNEPCTYDDTSWIKPIKYIGVWWEMFSAGKTWSYTNEDNTKIGITDLSKYPPNNTHAATTENVKKYIDFAAKHGFPQVLVEGWHTGLEDWYHLWKENIFDYKTSCPDYDLEYLRDYAKSKGVKIMMHHETTGSATNYERRLDEAFRFMVNNNFDAVKTGYVGYPIPRGEFRSGQWMVNHYNYVAQKAADFKISVDSHEAVRPTGLCRTFPNWLAQESARGTEFESMDGCNPDHTTILPFTRLMGGPMDYTPGIFQIKMNYYNPKNPAQIHTTLAKQLALYVTLYSPFHMAADLPENYERFPDAFQFIKDVAMDWDDTKILEAEPGDYITIARKTKGKNEWFVGGITDENPRVCTFDFSWLDPASKYEATIYEDAKDAHWKENPMSYNIRKVKVTSKSNMKIQLAASGGFAISVKEAP